MTSRSWFPARWTQRAVRARWILSIACTALLAVPATGQGSSAKGPLPYQGFDWQKLFDRSMGEPRLRRALLELDQTASRIVERDIAEFVRPMKLADILPSQRDSRANGLGANEEPFALALVDCTQSDLLRRDGVTVALAARYTGNPKYLYRSLEILVKFAAHAPMQRPGWSLPYVASGKLPPQGDGVWLATGWGMSGVVDMLTILGDRVPEPIRNSLRNLLREEVGRVRSDWEAEVPWYVRSRDVTANQWIEPSIGLVKACMYLDEPGLQPAYELGVRNLLATARTLPADGSFPEGFSYANMTSGSLCDIAEDMRRSGDGRLAEVGFVRNLWRWMLQSDVSGRRLMNFADSRMSTLPDYACRVPLPTLTQAAMASTDPDAVPGVMAVFPDYYGDSAIGIRWALRCLDARAAALDTLPRWWTFENGRQVVWRSRWARPSDPGAGWAIWLKGGNLLGEGHSHRDQGQVSVYARGQAVLMDCGTPDYSDPDFETRFAPACGHGIMQLRELKPRGRTVDAPIRVDRLDAEGGQVFMDTTRAYQGVKSCTRQVRWGPEGAVDLLDLVQLDLGPEKGEFYRFHLAGGPSTITGAGTRWNVSNASATLTFESDIPIEVTAEPWRDDVQEPFLHEAIRISTPAPAQRLELRTRLFLRSGP